MVCETAGHRDTVGLAHRLKQTNPRLTVMSITDTIAGMNPDTGRVDDFLLRPIDLDMIEGKALIFDDATQGKEYVTGDIPENMLELYEEWRLQMLEAIAEESMGACLWGTEQGAA